MSVTHSQMATGPPSVVFFGGYHKRLLYQYHLVNHKTLQSGTDQIGSMELVSTHINSLHRMVHLSNSLPQSPAGLKLFSNGIPLYQAHGSSRVTFMYL